MSWKRDVEEFLATRLPADVVERKCVRISSDKGLPTDVMERSCGRISSNKAAN